MSARPDAVKKRIAMFFLAMLVIIAGLAGRIAWLQFVEGGRLAKRVQGQLADIRDLKTPRGAIYDSKGRELAISFMAKSLYANPGELSVSPDEAARLLAPALGMKPEKIQALLASPAAFVWIKRTLEPEEAKAVSAIIAEHHLKGLAFIEESKRYYPNKSLAAQVLGFVGVDDVGLEGIEQAYDKLIRAENTRQILETDSQGTPILNSVLNYDSARPGRKIYLTIDSAIQLIVEQSLDKAMARTKAKAAVAIVMNPRTGEILAMASRPGFDPNHFERFSAEDWRNRAISIVYEPGSTFKSIVAAAAIQEKVVRPEDVFFDRGYVEVSGRRIGNWDHKSRGRITFTDAVKFSVNTPFVEVGERLGAGRLNEYARAFGFGRPTGIGLPGEEEGILFNPAKMLASDVATMAIGQSIAVTPLQLLTAVAALANGGVLLKPQIVKEIDNGDGTVITCSPQVVRQVVTPDTARTVVGLLEKVIAEGAGRAAAVPGYRFAGKTGTAEKPNPSSAGYEKGHYIASFVGFGPLENPQLAALVVIDDPVGEYYGGEVAGPVFSEIMSATLRYLTIPPTVGAAGALSGPPAPLPPSQGQTGRTAVRKAAPRPVPGPGQAVVPDVTGRSIREAGQLLTEAGLAFIPSGAGTAVRQSVPPNAIVPLGTEVTVEFQIRR